MRGRAEAARRAHNPEVGGSNPPPATKIKTSRTIVLLFLCSHAAKACFQLYGCVKKRRRSRACFGFGKALPKRITTERSNPLRNIKKRMAFRPSVLLFHPISDYSTSLRSPMTVPSIVAGIEIGELGNETLPVPDKMPSMERSASPTVPVKSRVTVTVDPSKLNE